MKLANRTCFFSIPLLGLLANACGGSSNSSPPSSLPPDVDEVRSSISRAVADDSKIEEVSAANTKFAGELYRAITANDDGKSLTFSPLSLSIAFGMLYQGAASSTAAQIASTFHFNPDKAETGAGFNALAQKLDALASANNRFEMSDRLWVQKGFSILPSYPDALGKDFGAGLFLIDFAEDDGERARATINKWVADQTEQRILGLFPEKSITRANRFVLTNTVYLNAKWQSPFEKSATRGEPFTMRDGSRANVDMMHNTDYFPAAKEDGYDAVELPYDGGDLSMLIVAPKAASFDATGKDLMVAFESARSKLADTRVGLAMPKFEFTFVPPALQGAFEGLGLVDVFTDAADLSGINGNRELVVSAVRHEAFIKVDETSTEAAAASGIGGDITSAPTKNPIEIRLDHPFYFSISHKPTGAVLFVGRYMGE